MNSSMYGDFEACISTPLSNSLGEKFSVAKNENKLVKISMK